MNELKPIYTQKTECQDCYKCVRECPVKAIKIEDNSACIIDELCVHCGKCVLVCPVGAKKIRNDVQRVKQYLNMGKKVILSIAPSWRAEFNNLPTYALIAALKKLGFAEVSETALGAQMVSSAVADLIEESEQPLFLSTACPTVVEMMYKYYPQYTKYFTPVLSPMVAHAKYLAEVGEPDTLIAFVGPCAAKKIEIELYGKSIVAVLTFDNLHKWFEEQGIDPYSFKTEEEENKEFYPFNALDGGLYPLDGGMIPGIRGRLKTKEIEFMNFSGLEGIMDAMHDIDKMESDKQIFIELLACEGGCINGPAMKAKKATVFKRDNVYRNVDSNIDSRPLLYDLKVDADIRIKPVEKSEYPEPVIRTALLRIGKQRVQDELNCSSCGYDSCRDFAVALLDGHAMENMCTSYMRKMASKKANALIKAIPAGVVIADSEMKVIECNKNFASIFGAEIEMIYNATPGMEGASLSKIIPFYKLFQKVLVTGEDIVDHDIAFNEHQLNVSIFSIEKEQVVGAVIQDIRVPHVRREQVVKRVEEVIRLNLETVQKIAYLLGENASETEIRLNNVLEAFNEEEEK